MAIGWWLFVHVAEWENGRRRLPVVAPRPCPAVDLIWARLAIEIEWRERVVVEVRGVLRSRADRAIPGWCMGFARDLRVQLIGTGRRELDRVKTMETARFHSVANGHETWHVRPSRPLAPGETLVVRYRLDTGVPDRLQVLDLVPTFAVSGDLDGSRSTVAKEVDLPDTIEIALDYSISAVGALPGALQRHWCRNDRRKLSTRWRLPRHPSVSQPEASRGGVIWVREASLEQCRYRGVSRQGSAES